MNTIYDALTALFGYDFKPVANPNRARDPFRRATFGSGKHAASKRGYKHDHRMSKGERNHAAFARKAKS
jgi:hypothetical protein